MLLIIKGSDKERWVHSCYGIAFDGAGLLNFVNDFAKNIVIFGVDYSSSSHANSRKNSFVVLREGPTDGINGSFSAPEKKFSIHFSKAGTKRCMRLHYSGENSYLLMKKKSLSLKLIIKTLTFQLNFV